MFVQYRNANAAQLECDGDLIPVNSPPPPPARYPTSPQVVVRTGAGRAANGLRGPPKGGLPGQNN